MIAPLIAIAALASDPSLADVIGDPRTMEYSDLPRVYEGIRHNLYRVEGHNPGVRGEDPTGTPNREKPWQHTGGLDDCGPEVTVRRLLWIPDGAKIVLYREHGMEQAMRPRPSRYPYSRTSWRFPVGTVFVEMLYESGRLFEVRSRRKVADEWETSQFEYGRKPRGYVAVDNCISCHEDITDHAIHLDPVRVWYFTVRGGERHGAFHWHPWEYTGDDCPMVIREEVREFVEWQQ